jgi:Porin PorA
MRKTAVACGIVGVILLAAAGLLAFWVTPAFIARLPSGSNTVRTFDGQIRSLVNPAALGRGDFAAAVKLGVPETIRRQVQVTQTSGNTALVRDASTVTAGGRQIGALTSQYAVDRSSLEATASHPSSWAVTNAKGLTVSWPIGAGQQDYTGWEHFTQTTTQLKYLRQEQHGGVNTYVYRATLPPTPIKNPQVLRALPKALPVTVLQGAGRAGLVPASVLASLAKILPPGVTQIPLGYVYAATSTYWVAPATGIVIDVRTTEQQLGGIALGSKIIPVLPVLVDSYQASPASVQAAATDANNGSSTIQLFGVILPIVFAAVGFVLLVIAVILWLRGHGRGREVPNVPAPPPVNVGV